MQFLKNGGSLKKSGFFEEGVGYEYVWKSDWVLVRQLAELDRD